MNHSFLFRCFGGGGISSWRTTTLVVLLGLLSFQKGVTFTNGFVTTPRRPKTTIPSSISSGTFGTGHREVLQQTPPPFVRTNNIRTTKLFLATSSPLPTIDQLLNDPFMKQVQYGSLLTEELMRHEKYNRFDDEDDEDTSTRSVAQSTASLSECIQAQLSHSDGIRGFMVSYLTADDDSDDKDDARPIPDVLLDALKLQAEKDPAQLVPLACA
jgi:hypothetical protein